MTALKRDVSFKKLQDTWYKTLKKEGFEDIEYFSNGEPLEWLKGSGRFASEGAALLLNPEEASAAEAAYQARLDYFNAATRLVNRKDIFTNESHRKVWELHIEGQSLRQIGRTIGFSHTKVMRILEKYKHFLKY